jgi:flagellar protein FlaG
MTFRGSLAGEFLPETRNPPDIFCRCFAVPAAALPFTVQSHYTASIMSLPTQPNLKLTNDPDYREAYANSVQMRVNVWDFFMVFGTLQQQTESQVEIRNFQGIYLSPQQAKALLGLLQQNVSGYESAFGEIKLDPRFSPPGPVH